MNLKHLPSNIQRWLNWNIHTSAANKDKRNRVYGLASDYCRYLKSYNSSAKTKKNASCPYSQYNKAWADNYMFKWKDYKKGEYHAAEQAIANAEKKFRAAERWPRNKDSERKNRRAEMYKQAKAYCDARNKFNSVSHKKLTGHCKYRGYTAAWSQQYRRDPWVEGNKSRYDHSRKMMAYYLGRFMHQQRQKYRWYNKKSHFQKLTAYVHALCSEISKYNRYSKMKIRGRTCGNMIGELQHNYNKYMKRY